MTQLCEIPGCRIKGRHLPHCDRDDCGGCLPRATESRACDVCTDRRAGWLNEIIRLAPDARLVAAGLVRRGSGGASGKPGSRLPLNDAATDALDEVTNTLTTIARDIAETRGLQIPAYGLGATDPLAKACSWLLGQMEWLRWAVDEQGGAYAAGVFTDIGDAASRVRGLVDGPSAAKYLGPCGAPQLIDVPTYSAPIEGPPCDGDVYGRAGADKGRCKTCGAQVDQGERHIWLDEVRRDWLFTAREIGEAYQLNVKTIRSWHTRGLLAAHGYDPAGTPLHKIGEVLDLAAGDAARREEARATRARRLEQQRSGGQAA